MIYPDYMLQQWAGNGGLQPYDPDCVNPASVDLRWSGKFRREQNGTWSPVGEKVCGEHLVIRPGELMLLDTLEVIHIPVICCGMITLKSSIGRMGLEHMHAGFFDPGFHGTGTLEVYNAATWNIKIEPHQRLVQIVLMELAGVPHNVYNGRYQGDMSPTPAKEVPHGYE